MDTSALSPSQRDFAAAVAARRAANMSQGVRAEIGRAALSCVLPAMTVGVVASGVLGGAQWIGNLATAASAVLWLVLLVVVVFGLAVVSDGCVRVERDVAVGLDVADEVAHNMIETDASFARRARRLFNRASYLAFVVGTAAAGWWLTFAAYTALLVLVAMLRLRSAEYWRKRLDMVERTRTTGADPASTVVDGTATQVG